MRGALQTLAFKEQRGENQYWQCKQIRDLAGRHLHTIRESNVHPLTAHPELTWHSEHNETAAMGAVTGPRHGFLRDNFTWVNLPKGDTYRGEEVETAMTAMTDSTKPARVLMLFKGTPMITVGKDVRAHILMSIPVGSVILTSTNTQETITQANTTPLTLLQIENKLAPVADYTRLQQEASLLQPKITIHQPPWATPREYYTNELPSLTIRHPGHQYPALSWYRMEPECEGSKPPKYRSQTDKMLAAIGAGPRNLGQILSSNGIPENMLTSETMNTIKERTRNTAYRAFTRQNRWAHADKYGPQGPRPEPSW